MSPQRTDDERLALFARKAFLLGQSSVIRDGRAYRFQMSWEASTETMRTTLNKPEFEALQSFLSILRDFDNPRDDLYLPEIIDILRRRLGTDYARGLDSAAAGWDDVHAGGGFILKLDGEDGPVLSPRDAFDLWVYSEHLHHDLAKERRMAALPAALQHLVRVAALEYTAALVELVSYVYGRVRVAIGEIEG